MDRHFFFATDFCETVSKLARVPGGTLSKFPFDAYVIEDSAGIGDLHGGIAGTHYSGFIGETYKKYPFPKDHDKFKQQTEGYKTRDEFAQMILNFGTPVDLVLYQNSAEKQISIGPYLFSRQNYLHLIEYVIRGGFPGWLDDIAPAYVDEMQKAVS